MVRRSVIQADPQVVVSQRLIEAIETMTDVLGLIHEQAQQGRPVAGPIKTLQQWSRAAVREARWLERLLPTEAAQPTK
jgi:hypothetical protein